MWIKKGIFICVLVVLSAGVFLYLFTLNSSRGSILNKESLQKLVPKDAYLRDYSTVDGGKTLLLYMEPGYKTDNWSFYSCPGAVLGNALVGRYHLALVQKDRVVNDVLIPGAYEDDGFVSLALQNTKSNLLKVGEYPESEKNTLVDVKLLDLKDLTGDGKANEFNIFTTGGGCGFYDGLVGGYDEVSNKAVLYSKWIPRFRPDKDGDYYYLFDCGDHGNDTKIEEKYRFNKDLRKFEKYWEIRTACQ